MQQSRPIKKHNPFNSKFLQKSHWKINAKKKRINTHWNKHTRLCNFFEIISINLLPLSYTIWRLELLHSERFPFPYWERVGGKTAKICLSFAQFPTKEILCRTFPGKRHFNIASNDRYTHPHTIFIRKRYTKLLCLI